MNHELWVYVIIKDLIPESHVCLNKVEMLWASSVGCGPRSSCRRVLSLPKECQHCDEPSIMKLAYSGLHFDLWCTGSSASGTCNVGRISGPLKLNCTLLVASLKLISMYSIYHRQDIDSKIKFVAMISIIVKFIKSY